METMANGSVAQRGQNVMDNSPLTTVTLRINGKSFTVDQTTSSRMRLVDFIRDVAQFKGTKVSCREGGCGACIVTAKVPDRPSKTDKVCAVNSCLIPVMLCDGWDITTVDGLGDRYKGHNEIQKRLAQFNGSQCGFCSPGMVMLMNSVQEQDPKFTMQDAENKLDGNICRCTGFRPILDTFKSFASDATDELKQEINRRCVDIEDLNKNGCCGKPEKCWFRTDPRPPIENRFLWIKANDGAQWFRPSGLKECFQIMDQLKNKSVRLVGANTASGVFKHEGPYDAYIDLSGIAELRERKLDPLTIGGGVTISECMKTLNDAYIQSEDNYGYLTVVLHHMQKIASHAIRDVGTVAGNIMMKYRDQGFASDLFLPFETAGVKVVIATKDGNTEMTMPDFLKIDMKNKVLLSFTFPVMDYTYVMRTFKVLPRYQFSHAYVNAGFLAKVDSAKNYQIIGQPRIVYGGISATFIHATRTEQYLTGKQLNSQDTLNGAIKILSEEIVPDSSQVETSPEFRKSLSLSLFYKYVLFVLKDVVGDRLKTGADHLERGVSYGKQDFDTDKSTWPLSKPVIKLEAMAQCSGEAEYINDIPHRPTDLHLAFVTSTQANAKLKQIDPSDALNMDGVVAFFTAQDIPGLNNFQMPGAIPEEFLCSGKVMFGGQSLGVIVAESPTLSVEAALKVKVEYTDVKKPILKIEEALEDEKRITRRDPILGPVGSKSTGSTKVIKGRFNTGHQYHFSIEPQTAYCIPTEDGMDVYAATQWIDHVQCAVAQVLGVQDNAINLQVRRLGGAYGAKITHPSLVSGCCALAAVKLNRPVRAVLDIDTNMKMLGRRFPYFVSYEVEVDQNGKFVSLKGDAICDCGMDTNESTSFFAVIAAQNSYDATNWNLVPASVITNTAANVYCRSPGTVQGIAIIETIMEHVARELKMDPWEVRNANMLKPGDMMITKTLYGTLAPMEEVEEFPLPKMVTQLKESSNYDTRRVEINEFNKNNRWRKKGLAMIPMRWPVEYGIPFPMFVVIYHEDGTVAVSQGGIEMGQGINTKVAQVVAYELGIPLDLIKVKASNNLVGANGGCTGGAIGSDLCAYAAQMCCKILNERLQPIREKMQNPTWQELVANCYNSGINLAAHYMESPTDGVKTYHVYGVTAVEVEMDILTGQTIVRRADILEDAGISMNPDVDIGQVEGAFVMGLGLWMTEKFRFDVNTGELLTHNTWEYKPPSSRDIPENFYVTLLKKAPNPYGVLRSKSTGEAPLCMASCVLFAMRDALDSARAEQGRSDWYQMDGPTTVEDAFGHCLSTPDQFVLK